MQASLRDLQESTINKLGELRQVLKVEATQLAEIDEADAIQADKEVIERQFAQTEPWKGYAEASPAADAIKERYRSCRARFKREQDETLKAMKERIIARQEFADLDSEEQDDILACLGQSYRDIDSEAVEPRLVSLSRYGIQLREAEDRAQRRIDEIINGKRKVEKVQTLKSGFRNKVISSPAELDLSLADIRERCLAILARGDTVRFEE